MPRAFMKSFLIVTLLCVITWGVGRLPLVPSWHILKSGLSIVFVMISLIVVIANVVKVYRFTRNSRCSIFCLIGGGAAGILWMLFCWYVFLEVNGISSLGGTTLKRTIPVSSTNGTIYIYETGTFPDGVDSTKITYGSKWNPFEKELYVTKELYAAEKLGSHHIDIFFMHGNQKRFYLDSLKK